MKSVDPGAPDAVDNGLAAFVSMRARLLAIAHRMLGNGAEAEDIVQDVWLRWQTADRSVVRDPRAFLITATVRLAINRTKSACSRREAQPGRSLPEPVDPSADHTLCADRRQDLGLAVFLLLAKLSPTERGAYVLREAFNYEYSEIAGIIGVSEVNCRQLVTRGRKHLADQRRASVSQTEQRRLLEAFLGAARKGNLAALEGFFAWDVSSKVGSHQLLWTTRPSKLIAFASPQSESLHGDAVGGWQEPSRVGRSLAAEVHS